ncbi:MAG TPA: M28 family peptidase, partial [Ignavibacteriaceae bacterium]|nr:M28 family peptidase [Ignavibacteriaceae bacterium]
MKRFSLFFAILVAVSFNFSAPVLRAQSNGQKFIDKSNIKLNLEFLASDELEGRETTTRGIHLAALYITTQLQRNGVKPFFDDGSYYEPFKVDASTFNEDSKLVFTNGNNTSDFKFLNDFFVDSRNSSGEVNDALPVVFVGYGITAPEYKYDNYANIDVKGKYVIAMSGEPTSKDENYFDGEKETKYSSARTKVEFAKEHGAAGFLGTLSPEYETRWDFIKRFFSHPSMSIMDDSNNDENNFVSVYIKSTALKQILSGQKFSYDDLEAKAENGEALPEFQINGKLKSEIVKTPDIRTAKNIVGVIEGIDPVLKNEYVAVGAHYDHLGVQNGKVYNGADDDGSGTVTVMEVAKALAKT